MSGKVLLLSRKKETVKAIFDCESKYLGVQNAVSLEFSDNLPSSLYYEVRAQYDSNNRKITIKDGLLDYDNDEVFMVIAEEVYHAYEHDMMELYSQTLTESQKSLWCFKDVGAWIKNNDSYVIGGNSSYEAYIRYLNGDPLLGYENDDDKRSFEFLAELTGETETRSYRNHVYDYLNPDQED